LILVKTGLNENRLPDPQIITVKDYGQVKAIWQKV